MLQYQHSPLVHVAMMKSNLCNTSAAINLLTTMVVPNQKPHGASQQQGFCLPNLGEHSKEVNCSENSSYNRPHRNNMKLHSKLAFST